MTIHATALAINDRAVLIRGPSGAGKSDVALRMLALPQDCLRAIGIAKCEVRLIADDRVVVSVDRDQIILSAPPSLLGKLEVRGVGILNVDCCADRVPLALIVDLVPREDVMRMPDQTPMVLQGIALPALKFAAFEPSTPLKIALSVARVQSAPRPSE